MGHSHSHVNLESQFARTDEASKKRYREVMRVTLIGSFFDLLLAIVKIVGGFLAHSTALIADGVHSLSDLFTDFIVIYAAKHAHREADEEHPYGHGRIETLATVVLGLALFAVAVGITWDAVERLFEPERLWKPGILAIVLAGISIIVKEALYHYSMYIARKYRSNMLKANAWHSRTDAISSVIVVIGVAGSMAGLAYLDAIAAIGVALMIIKIAWDLIWHSVRELIDTGLKPERLTAIRESILAVDGVQALHVLRTRSMGSDALVDVHIQVNPDLSVTEGHHIGETVRDQVIQEIEEVADVMVHIDPEDDEVIAKNIALPLRKEMLEILKAHWSVLPIAKEIRDENVILHYIEGRIRVEIILPLAVLGENPIVSRDEIAAQFDGLAKKLEQVERISVLYQ